MAVVSVVVLGLLVLVLSVLAVAIAVNAKKILTWRAQGETIDAARPLLR